MDTCCNCEKSAPEVDLRYGDCCLDCLPLDCDRCDQPIDLDQERRLVNNAGNCYSVVCDGCVETDDRVDA